MGGQPQPQQAAEEVALRERILQRPKNGRIRAELSFYLTEQGKGKSPGDPAREALQKEAVHFAEQAIQIAPQKPFGYAALSVASPDPQRRMKALRSAIQHSDHPSHFMAKIDLMVSLLVVPRQTGDDKQQNRRDLGKEELTLYERIQQGLEDAWATHNLDEKNMEFLALREYRLGLFFRKMNPKDKNQPRSRAHFRRACKGLPRTHPSYSLAEFWLATMDDTQAITKCPADYVVGLYSTFAAKFDDLLVGKLAYKTPNHLRELVDETVAKDTTQKWAGRAADLGCGTGLSGAAFRDCVGELVGVDLSPEMIEKARQRNCYESLVQGDVTAILSPQAGYSLIFACDVFVYLGDLATVFAQAHESLLQDGIFAFSTELLDEKDEHSFMLHECARFAHKRSYIESLAAESSFAVLATKCRPIRKNAGTDVNGFLTVLQRV